MERTTVANEGRSSLHAGLRVDVSCSACELPRRSMFVRVCVWVSWMAGMHMVAVEGESCSRWLLWAEVLEMT